MRLRRMSLAEISERNRARARDEDLLASGWTPSPAQLADAPYIDAWEETTYPGGGPGEGLPSLKGRVSGHPLLGTTYAWTSPVIARGDGWVRTEGRFYRLGEPASPAPPAPPRQAPEYPPEEVLPVDLGLDHLPDYGVR